jgi:hypothetical protein
MRHLRLLLRTAALASAFPCSALPLAAQSEIIPSLGAGFVAQRAGHGGVETAFGYTATAAVAYPLSAALRLHADLRYSFDLSVGSEAASPCPAACPPSGLSASKVLSTVLGVELVTSQKHLGLLLRLGGGLHHISDPRGTGGLYPALALAVGVQVPLGGRRAFRVEARYDRLSGVAQGPRELVPLLIGFDL